MTARRYPFDRPLRSSADTGLNRSRIKELSFQDFCCFTHAESRKFKLSQFPGVLFFRSIKFISMFLPNSNLFVSQCRKITTIRCDRLEGQTHLVTASFLKVFDFHIPICLYACNFPQCSLHIPMALTGRICSLINVVYNLEIISFILMIVNRDSDQQCCCYETKHVHSKE